MSVRPSVRHTQVEFLRIWKSATFYCVMNFTPVGVLDERGLLTEEAVVGVLIDFLDASLHLSVRPSVSIKVY